jgi:hypothetical protein
MSDVRLFYMTIENYRTSVLSADSVPVCGGGPFPHGAAESRAGVSLRAVVMLLILWILGTWGRWTFPISGVLPQALFWNDYGCSTERRSRMINMLPEDVLPIFCPRGALRGRGDQCFDLISVIASPFLRLGISAAAPFRLRVKKRTTTPSPCVKKRARMQRWLPRKRNALHRSGRGRTPSK